MAKIEITLGELFDCYADLEKAMTKEKFVRLVSDLFAEWEAGKCVSNAILPDGSSSVCRHKC